MAIEIVDLPIENGDLPLFWYSLPFRVPGWNFLAGLLPCQRKKTSGPCAAMISMIYIGSNMTMANHNGWEILNFNGLDVFLGWKRMVFPSIEIQPFSS